MANYVSGPVLLVKGLVEGLVGKVKDVIGTVLGRDDLTRAGRAQQDKADAQRHAGKKEAQANRARVDAKTHEERERAEQGR
jgi:uncharacterized protein YjbJ (UPF0337 family)